MNLNKDESGDFLDVTLNAELNGVDQAQAEALVAKAHTICPYSKATRGNIEVKLQANGSALQHPTKKNNRRPRVNFQLWQCESVPGSPCPCGFKFKINLYFWVG